MKVHSRQEPCMHSVIQPSQKHSLCKVCMYILALGFLLFVLENIFFVGFFRALGNNSWARITHGLVFSWCSSSWKTEHTMRRADVTLFWCNKQLPEAKIQKLELGKHKYKGKCQEIQDFCTNEVFRSNESSIHNSSVFLSSSWLAGFCARQAGWTV